jgi:hypothetical protein
MVPKRLNKDFFLNRSSQSWWHLRTRFQNTHRAVAERLPVSVDEIISINPQLPELLPLTMELSQVRYGITATGKVQIEKTPAGMRSPNLADLDSARASGPAPARSGAPPRPASAASLVVMPAALVEPLGAPANFNINAFICATSAALNNPSASTKPPKRASTSACCGIPPLPS